jgi:hypothetical protein
MSHLIGDRVRPINIRQVEKSLRSSNASFKKILRLLTKQEFVELSTIFSFLYRLFSVEKLLQRRPVSILTQIRIRRFYLIFRVPELDSAIRIGLHPYLDYGILNKTVILGENLRK